MSLIKLIQILRTPSIGYATFHNLLSIYHDIDTIYEKLNNNYSFSLRLLKQYNIKTEKLSLVSEEVAQNEIDTTYRLGGKFIMYNTSEFPDSLRQMRYYPPLLISKGPINILHNKNICGISGSRTSSLHSVHVAESLSKELASRGFVLATGASGPIDLACHHSGARQIAVVPFSLSNFNSNHKDILSYGGTVITDIGMYERTQKYHFLRRNKIMVALSKSVIVVESKMNSGSYQTGLNAISMNKILYVMPGFDMQNNLSGNASLIEKGAKTFTSINKFMCDMFEVRQPKLFEDGRENYRALRGINNHMREQILEASIRYCGKVVDDHAGIVALSKITNHPVSVVHHIILEFVMFIDRNYYDILNFDI